MLVEFVYPFFDEGIALALALDLALALPALALVVDPVELSYV